MAKKQDRTVEQLLEEALVLDEKTPYKLPPNWCWVKLKSITNITSGGTPARNNSKNWDGGVIPWVKISDLSGKYVDVTEEKITQFGLDNSSAKIFKKGTILYTIFATIGEVAILNIDAATNQAIAGITCIEPYNLHYNYYVLLVMKDLLVAKAKGVAQVNINQNILREACLPLAPLEEQKRIVELIEKQFARLDEARELIQKSLDYYADRKSALLHRAFTGELTKKWREEKNLSFNNWTQTVLNNVAKWSSGGTPSRKNKEYFIGDIPWVKTGELNNGYIYNSEEKITEEAIKHSSVKLFPAGSVLIAMYGATIGQCAILAISATTNQACACGIANADINNKFLFYYLISQKSNFVSLGKGGAQPNISQKVIKEYPILVPSTLEEQEEIVRILDSILEKEDKSKELIDTLEKIDEMKKSILARAFRGELGTSDPADEPAAELLKRILENKIASQK